MQTNGLDCCAVTEIVDLGTHKDARVAMLNFCRDHKCYGNKIDDVGAFYIFTGVVKFQRGAGYGGVTYGPNFADLIKKNKLGTLVESPSRANRVNHPDHTVKVWVWCPSIRGLNRWYEENKPKREKKSAHEPLSNYDDDPGW